MSFKITVKYGKNRYRNIEIEPNHSFTDIQQIIQSLTNVEPRRQKLMISGHKLCDTESMRIYLKNKCIITVVGSMQQKCIIPTCTKKGNIDFIEDMKPMNKLICGYMLIHSNKLIRGRSKDIINIINAFYYDPVNPLLVYKWHTYDIKEYELQLYIRIERGYEEFILDIKDNPDKTYKMSYEWKDGLKFYRYCFEGNYKVIDKDCIQLLFDINQVNNVGFIHGQIHCKGSDKAFKNLSVYCIVNVNVYVKTNDIECTVSNPKAGIVWHVFRRFNRGI